MATDGRVGAGAVPGLLLVRLPVPLAEPACASWRNRLSTVSAGGLGGQLDGQVYWIRIRHSNFIERTVGETRRRVKVIGRLPGETACLGLVWAVLDGACAAWRGVTRTLTGLRLLQDLRRNLLQPPAQLPPPAPLDHPRHRSTQPTPRLQTQSLPSPNITK